MNAAQMKRALTLFDKGALLTSSILRGAFDTWPCVSIPSCADENLCEFCYDYNRLAPEIAALEACRAKIGTPAIADWEAGRDRSEVRAVLLSLLEADDTRV